ncbi:hypothetical protein GJW-30_1_03151 [Variibacter gotjawalensis]|uniref:Uncharacterized protein n=1 Tax=Variibacter gotjawalensis TaxID=1333996 RepID=A0A0S3PXF0_9BRAD|nr:hypothetical protein [Variibacter gotjawalensis]NIK46433.1 hypothetical protein [Variibacter gotjawalensis]RZS48343.1 hypothetical protein EV661_0753 [Variibacter gotjawalensis]BAT60603.1 hypothetical protein GJW-30_1_03151 [Variibacter gotjawalensis]
MMWLNLRPLQCYVSYDYPRGHPRISIEVASTATYSDVFELATGEKFCDPRFGATISAGVTLFTRTEADAAGPIGRMFYVGRAEDGSRLDFSFGMPLTQIDSLASELVAGRTPVRITIELAHDWKDANDPLRSNHNSTLWLNEPPNERDVDIVNLNVQFQTMPPRENSSDEPAPRSPLQDVSSRLDAISSRLEAWEASLNSAARTLVLVASVIFLAYLTRSMWLWFAA